MLNNVEQNKNNLGVIFKLAKKTLDKTTKDNSNLYRPEGLEDLDDYTKLTNSVILNTIRKNLNV